MSSSAGVCIDNGFPNTTQNGYLGLGEPVPAMFYDQQMNSNGTASVLDPQFQFNNKDGKMGVQRGKGGVNFQDDFGLNMSVGLRRLISFLLVYFLKNKEMIAFPA